MNRKNQLVFTFLNCLLLSGCVTVKEYQKSKINDAEMELSNRKVEKFETSFYLYREGASGANGGKSSGGCGCN
jgi:protein involved in sex pheromone biosynthesis